MGFLRYVNRQSGRIVPHGCCCHRPCRTSDSKDLALLLGTGLLGGLTTMSAFSVETIQLIENQQTGLAVGYVSLTMLLCPLLALLGWKLSETILTST